MVWTPPPTACVRRAWLELAGATVQLEDSGLGYFCSSLDLGYPTVRDVVTNRPDQDGIIDRTQYMGPRTVTVQISAVVGAGARIDEVAAMFGPFMVPSSRPVLHYVLDRAGGPAERTLNCRPAGYAWPIVGADQRDLQLQFVADPVAFDPASESVAAWSGGLGGGRGYNLTFPRTYPAGGGAPSSATIVTAGDLPVQPALRVYGPISGAAISFAPTIGSSSAVRFLPSYTIGAGHFVDVDTRRKTAYLDGDPAQSAITALDWLRTVWPVLPVAPASTQMTVTGSNTSSATQVVATWQDKYLT
jgi:hypothetical protein